LKPKVEAWIETQSGGPASATVADAEDRSNAERQTAEQPSSPSSNSPSKKTNSEEEFPKKSSGDVVGTAKTQTKTPGKSSDASVTEVDYSGARTKEKSSAEAATTKNQKAGVDLSTIDPKTADSIASKSQEPASSNGSAKGKKSKNNGSSVVKMDQPPATRRTEVSDAEKSNPPPGKKEESSEPRLGVLREVENNVFESTAGLHYVPGGAEGHRLKHVMQHAKDVPQKEVHGVFDGNRDEILAVIDEAYVKAKKGGSDVRSEKQNNRRVYTVNLRRRIGQVGGRQGERQGNPDCRYLRLVLEHDTEVVSAFPTKSF
jgi:hypothetical protein